MRADGVARPDTGRPWTLRSWRTVACLAVWAGLSTGAWAQATSSMEVRLWAASCAACHGTDGKAEGTGLYLAGRSADDLYERLLGYKRGTIPATVMHQHAKGYTDEELRQLAEHFSRIQ